MRGHSAESILVLAVTLLSLAIGLAGVELTSRRYEQKVEEVGQHVLTSAAEAFAVQQRSEAEKLSAVLEAVMASEELRAAFVARDRERLQRLAQPLLEGLREHNRITHWYFFTPEPEPHVFLRVHRPDLFGDAPKRATLRRAVESGAVGAGLELGKTAFALRVVRPWIHQGVVLGYLELAQEIDHFLTALKGRSGDEYGLLVAKRYLDAEAWASAAGPHASSWNDRDDALVVDATGDTTGIRDWRGDIESLPPLGLTLGELDRGDRVFIRALFPVLDAAGRRAGALAVVHDFTDHHLAVQQGHTFALALTLLAALGAAAGVAILVNLLVFRRLAALRSRLERRAGDLKPEVREVAQERHDDLGRLEVLFDRVLGPDPASGREPPGRVPP
jgi:hypothetical protein